MVLLADEARRDGLEYNKGVIVDLRVKRILGLNQALTRLMINQLGTPTPKELEEFYNKQQAGGVTQAPAVTLGHIVVDDVEGVRAVGRALRSGTSFKQVASQMSLDAKDLKDGYILGQISGSEKALPGVGENPALIARLAAMDDGMTTGPIKLESGYHWFKVVQRTGGQAQRAPLSQVQDEVVLNYQKQQLALKRAGLIAQLHKSRKIEVMMDKLAPADQLTTPTTPKAALPETTATQKVQPTPAATPSPATGKETPAAEPQEEHADQPDANDTQN
jgi:hypothetical protein